MIRENQVFSLAQRFITMECCNCHTIFAVLEETNQQWLDTGKNFYCPNGHVQHYSESTVQKLQKQLTRATKDRDLFRRQHQQEIDNHRHTEAQRRGEKAAKTRLKNRIVNGVCPCCNRHFNNLQQHMSTKHPNFLEQNQ